MIEANILKTSKTLLNKQASETLKLKIYQRLLAGIPEINLPIFKLSHIKYLYHLEYTKNKFHYRYGIYDTQEI